MESWVFLALLSTIFWAISAVLIKYTLKGIREHEFGAISYTIGAIIFVLYYLLFSGSTISLNPIDLFFPLVSAIFLVGGSYFYLVSLKKEDVSIVTPINSTSSLYTILLSIIFLGEVLTTNQIIAVSLLLLGTYMASVKKRNILQPILYVIRGNGKYPLFASIFYGISFFLIKVALNYIDYVGLMTLHEISIALFWIFIFVYKEKKPIKKISHVLKKSWIPIIGATIFTLAQLPPYFLSLETGPVSIITPLSFSGIFLIVFAGNLFFKEKHTLIRIIGSGLILIGVSLLTI